MTREELRLVAEKSIGAARLDLARGKGSKRLLCLLNGLIAELNEQKPIQDVIDAQLVALEKLGWRP